MRIYISGQLSVLEFGNLKQLHSEKGISIVASNSDDTRKRIELLINCDAIYFVNGWQKTIYSYIELSIAEINNIEIRYQNKQQSQ
jgi:hypothetical protein